MSYMLVFFLRSAYFYLKYEQILANTCKMYIKKKIYGFGTLKKVYVFGMVLLVYYSIFVRILFVYCRFARIC